MEEKSNNNELFQYYNERAPEYEAFYAGEFPTGPRHPNLYKADTQAVQKLLPHYVKKKCIDIACGTGFWLPCYYRQCQAITLIDQSEGVLEECRKKIRRLGIEDKIQILQGDIFTGIPPNNSFDSAVIGFLISHFRDNELGKFINVLKASLAPKGRFVIIDSVWGDEAKAFHKEQSGMTTRRLFNGQEFSIYKRYFEEKDLQQMAKRHHFQFEIPYRGKVFFLAAGRFS